VGTRDDALVVNNFVRHTFSVSSVIHEKIQNFSWKLIVVYGPAYDDKKVEFIDELYSILTGWQGPVMIGGDFNLCRQASDKSNGRIKQGFADCFNDWINRWGLIELNSTNRKYTWSNNQVTPVLAKLDRIFVSTDWEGAFPLARVSSLPKGISDHTPLLIDTGSNVSFGKKKFRFEKWWLERGDFREVVMKAWNTLSSLADPMEVWQNKIRNLRRMVRGWASNVVAELNKYEQAVTAEYNWLDEEEERRSLTAEEKDRLRILSRELEHIWSLEEIRARQRARDRIIKEGDRNTSYFHVVANQRCRKKRIECLQGPNGLVNDTSEILKVAASYYKNLFKKEERGVVSLDANFWPLRRESRILRIWGWNPLSLSKR
jgi:hypothetical protein